MGMTGKQVEGDNVLRREHGRKARYEGAEPSEAHVTLGASKAPEHLSRGGTGHRGRMLARRRGKQRGAWRAGAILRREP